MNPHFPRVWNEMIMESQLKLLFHTDDVFMVHPLSHVVTDQIKFLDKYYGQKDPLTVTRGKVHECLGMTVDFRTRHIVTFS